MKINNYIGNFQLNSIFKKNDLKDEFSAKITELCKQFKQENNLIDIVKIFNKNHNLKMQEPSAYIMGNYKILIGTRENIQDYKKILTTLNKHNIISCPRLEQYVNNKNKQYIMLVLKAPESEALMKSFKTNSNNVDTIAKCRFVNDLKDIAKHGKYYNPVIIEDIDSIKIMSDGNLYVTDWKFTDKFSSDKEQTVYFNKLRKLFNLILY